MNNKFISLILMLSLSVHLSAQKIPLRIGIAGLTHTHVHWIFESEKRGDIQIVGIVETNKDLAQRYADQHGYSMDIVFNSLDEMVNQVAPEAVSAFGPINEHIKVVEFCAPLGIHVMVEKPLATTLEDAKKNGRVGPKTRNSFAHQL